MGVLAAFLCVTASLQAQSVLPPAPSLLPAEEPEFRPVPELRPSTPAETTKGETREPRLIEDDWLLVVAENATAASAILDIGQAVVEVGQREWLFGRTLRESVIVRLIEAAPAGPEDAPYAVRFAKDGPVTLSLRWHAEAPFDDVVQGLAHALLVANVRERARGQAPAPPPWLVHALALETQVALQPLRRQWLAREALSMELPALEQLMELTAYFGGDRRRLALASYWLVQTLRAEAVDRSAYERLLSERLREEGGREALDALVFGTELDDAARELWWAVHFQAQVRSRLGPVLPLEDSRRLLERLSLLRAFVAEAEREFAPADLWPVRSDAAVRSAVFQRVREVKVEVPAINPVYHNALLSLGAFYEVLLREDVEEAEFVQALANWQSEKLFAGRLQADVLETVP